MSKFSDGPRLIFDSPFWQVVLSNDQTYIGSAQILLKRGACGDLADVTDEELVDLHRLIKKMENALRKAFDATMFNWSCLMNSAFKKFPPDPRVHWQFIPRYNHSVFFCGLEFKDLNFGRHYKQTSVMEVSDEIKISIVNQIKKFL